MDPNLNNFRETDESLEGANEDALENPQDTAPAASATPTDSNLNPGLFEELDHQGNLATNVFDHSNRSSSAGQSSGSQSSATQNPQQRDAATSDRGEVSDDSPEKPLLICTKSRDEPNMTDNALIISVFLKNSIGSMYMRDILAGIRADYPFYHSIDDATMLKRMKLAITLREDLFKDLSPIADLDSIARLRRSWKRYIIDKHDGTARSPLVVQYAGDKYNSPILEPNYLGPELAFLAFESTRKSSMTMDELISELKRMFPVYNKDDGRLEGKVHHINANPANFDKNGDLFSLRGPMENYSIHAMPRGDYCVYMLRFRNNNGDE